MISNFFHTPKAKKFYIRPRYWDPDQEERDAREQRIKSELGMNDPNRGDGKEYKPNIRGQFRNSATWQAQSEEGRKAQQKRLIWLIAILGIAVLMIFFADKIF